AYRGSRDSLGRFVLRIARRRYPRAPAAAHARLRFPPGARVESNWADEYPVRDSARCEWIERERFLRSDEGLCARSESASLAHGAVRVESDRRADGEDCRPIDDWAQAAGISTGERG